MNKQSSSLLLALALFATPVLSGFGLLDADAHRGHGRYRIPPGHARKMAYFPGYGNHYPSYYRDGVPFFQTRTGKIVKGSLIGAGIGAVVGAGIQAARYSGW
ncbi:MAG: hypothetical protein SFZ03_05195 [Candidatus Melainabacteria bacterium]|nr:hypothetical protein [Candidatus Melainabacteria bacterium]